jgi:hypothetical protein
MLFVQRCDSVFLCTKLGVYFLLHKFCCLKKHKKGVRNRRRQDALFCRFGNVVGLQKKEALPFLP